jgi:hypothetical protein
MGDEYEYIHFFNGWENKAGGYTIVVNKTRNVIGIAVCSPNDQYERKQGVKRAKARIYKTLETLSGAPFDFDPAQDMVTIAAPAMFVADSKVLDSEVFTLRRAAISRAVNLAARMCPLDGGVLIMFDEKTAAWSTPTKEMLHA